MHLIIIICFISAKLSFGTCTKCIFSILIVNSKLRLWPRWFSIFIRASNVFPLKFCWANVFFLYWKYNISVCPSQITTIIIKRFFRCLLNWFVHILMDFSMWTWVTHIKTLQYCCEASRENTDLHSRFFNHSHSHIHNKLTTSWFKWIIWLLEKSHFIAFIALFQFLHNLVLATKSHNLHDNTFLFYVTINKIFI